MADRALRDELCALGILVGSRRAPLDRHRGKETEEQDDEDA
jgi:hypothetical protein